MRHVSCKVRYGSWLTAATLTVFVVATPSHGQWIKVPNITAPRMTPPGFGNPQIGRVPTFSSPTAPPIHWPSTHGPQSRFPNMHFPGQPGHPHIMPSLPSPRIGTLPPLSMRFQPSMPPHLSMGSGWYQQGYRMSPPQITIHDVEREGGQAVGVLGQVGQTLFQGFVGGGMNGQGGGRYDADDDQPRRTGTSEDETATPPEEVTGTFLNPGQIRMPRIAPPRVRLPW
jgi:hypothetical protein